jgi:hypothetical protein
MPPAVALTPEQLADIVGSTGSHFQVTVDHGSISGPSLSTGGQVTLISPQIVDVVSLPTGASTLTFGMVFAPGEPAATIGVGKISNGSATPNPGRTIANNEPAPAVYLFGK